MFQEGLHAANNRLKNRIFPTAGGEMGSRWVAGLEVLIVIWCLWIYLFIWNSWISWNKTHLKRLNCHLSHTLHLPVVDVVDPLIALVRGGGVLWTSCVMLSIPATWHNNNNRKWTCTLRGSVTDWNARSKDCLLWNQLGGGGGGGGGVTTVSVLFDFFMIHSVICAQMESESKSSILFVTCVCVCVSMCMKQW